MTTLKPPYTVIRSNPSFIDTVVHFRGEDYFYAAAGVVGAFVLLDKPGTPAALRVKYGLIASLGSFSYTYVKSYMRLKGNLPNYQEVKKLMDRVKSKEIENQLDK